MGPGYSVVGPGSTVAQNLGAVLAVAPTAYLFFRLVALDKRIDAMEKRIDAVAEDVGELQRSMASSLAEGA
ncbi:hypothetical protein HYH03_008974 [Edaphochlamys debaryana]|uniref:Uncharacterized protein n=1 Tax=Edaphochlamys debaryana TaxID=47281 RepID=A0A835Y2C4_9CHLO|nr:hypothetical protein HYH03_008974 [Edaphochlamys debaryana]|eukprot:KAG2492816.1 hypothetical protein HYH03_008974 [Edaphochlamys debaryana]